MLSPTTLFYLFTLQHLKIVVFTDDPPSTFPLACGDHHDELMRYLRRGNAPVECSSNCIWHPSRDGLLDMGATLSPCVVWQIDKQGVLYAAAAVDRVRTSMFPAGDHTWNRAAAAHGNTAVHGAEPQQFVAAARHK